MTLTKNNRAPDFTLKTKTTDGLKDIKLSDNIGKQPIVLLFFPFAFTGGCTKEMCAISEDFSSYEKLNAIVYAISVDSPFAQEAWAKQNNIRIPVLSDFNKQTAKEYGVLYEDFLGFKEVAKRSAFIINKEGLIAYSWVSEDPHNLPNFDELKDVLKNQ